VYFSNVKKSILSIQNNILVICSWSHLDPLVHRYVLSNIPYIRSQVTDNATIHLITYEMDPDVFVSTTGQLFQSQIASEHIVWKPLPYAPLRGQGWRHYWRQISITRRYCRTERIAIVHAFAPTAGALGWLGVRWSKRKLVIDSWEPHAESMVETGVWRKNSIAFRLLWLLEKWCARDADYLIAAHPSMRTYAAEKWQLRPERVAYRPACTDLTQFDRNKFDRTIIRHELDYVESDLLCVCVSQLGGMYYLEESLQLFQLGIRVFGDRFKVLLITTTPKEFILKKGHSLGLAMDHVQILRSAPEDVPGYISIGQFAYNPQKAVPSKRYGTPVKNGEYWAMGLPILMMTGTSQDAPLALDHRTGVTLLNMQEDSIIRALKEMKRLLEEPELEARCRAMAHTYRHYDIANAAYQEVYNYLRSVLS
jgi:hypothetical protein